MSDWNLISKYTQGDGDALEELVRQHIDFVYGMARRRVGPHAEDVTQAVFLLLAQKAASLHPTGSLIGWLYGTTRLCCLNLRRLEARRVRRERLAALPETLTMDTDSAETASLLEAGLSLLGRRDRDAVLLHHLERKTLVETGRLLGITEAAARKRAQRGVEKLRQFFMKRGYAMAIGTLTAILLEESAKAAPAGLGATVSASGGMAGVGKAALLAKVTGNSMVAMSGKAVAAVAAVLLTAAAGLSVYRWTTPVLGQGPTVVPVMAPLAEEVDEATPPGSVCWAITIMLVDANGAEALRKATGVIDAKATFYELRDGNSSAIRSAVKTMRGDGQIIKTYDTSTWPLRPSSNSALMPLPLGGYSPQIARNGHGLSFINSLGEKMDTTPILAKTLDSQNAILEFKVEDTPAGLQIAPLGRDGAPRPIQNPNAPGVERLEKNASVHWTGTVKPGRMVVMLGDFGEWQGDHVVSARIIEIYMATELESRYMGVMASDLWSDGGLAELRNTADRALVWAAKRDFPSSQPAGQEDHWTRRLSDGTTVRLVAVAKPQEMPLCRWDGDGQPLQIPDNGANLMRSAIGNKIGAGPPAYSVALQVNPHVPRPDNGSGQNVRTIVPEDLNRVRLFVGVGDWTVQPIVEKGTVKVGKSSITLAQVLTNPNRIHLSADGELVPEMEVHLGVVTKDGRQLRGSNVAGSWDCVFSPITSALGSFDLSVDQVDHYVVFSRPREEVVFEGFKDTPLVEMPQSVTLAEVRAAEDKIADLEWKEQWRDIARDLAQADAAPRNPTTPAGTWRLMLDKALAQDAKGLREYLSGDEDRVAAAIEMVITHARLLKALEKKYGLDAMCRAAFETRRAWPVMVKASGQFEPGGWTLRNNKAYNTRWGLSLELRDGRWCYNVNQDTAAIFNANRTEDEALLRDLESGKFKTAGEAVKQSKPGRGFILPFVF